MSNLSYAHDNDVFHFIFSIILICEMRKLYKNFYYTVNICWSAFSLIKSNCIHQIENFSTIFTVFFSIKTSYLNFFIDNLSLTRAAANIIYSMQTHMINNNKINLLNYYTKYENNNFIHICIVCLNTQRTQKERKSNILLAWYKC